jgi:hypothetical protein
MLEAGGPPDRHPTGNLCPIHSRSHRE